jgi:indole-3-glycerol phosphate synthase
MTSAVPTVLERIVAHKRAELATAAAERPIDSLLPNAYRAKADRRDFDAALRAARPSIIAELKKASPSKGLLAPRYAPSATAAAYEHGGAAALSVLTDSQFFQGSLEDMQAARAATRISVLRKDFTIDRYHVVEAAANGADAILLIAAILSDSELRDYREVAESFGMSALVEVHDGEELSRAIDSGSRIIGVNNRDLRTFEVKLETCLALAPRIPTSAVRVAESGIRSRSDIQMLSEAGFQAFLIGEQLITSSDPAAEIRTLRA